MSADLGEFEGLPILSQKVVLKGTGDGLSKAVAVKPVHIAKGESVDFLVRAVAGPVQFEPHKDDDEAWVRVDVFNATTITIVDREFAEEKIAQQEEANDRRAGKQRIPFPPPVDKGELIHTDASGVQIIGEADIEAARQRGETVVETTPVIAEYNGDSDHRRMWPDEFGKGDPRPKVGDETLDGAVTSLIDPTTGDVLEPAVEAVGEFTEGGDDDALIDGTPAEVPPLSSAGDVDPALVDFLTGPVAEVRLRVAGQLSASFLEGALSVELGGPNKARPAVVSVLRARIAELDGFT